MKKNVKNAKQILRVILAGVMGIGACASTALITADAVEIQAEAASDVEINDANFPDEKFRAYVSEDIDKDGDGKLSSAEIAACEEIDVILYGISDLRGIQYFTALKKLNCYGNNLSSLDVSKNANLESLDCCRNALSSLDVSKNANLVELICWYNNLSSLDVSKNANLVKLDCSGNNLSSLDVSKNANLLYLYCGENNLSSLDVSKNANLVELYCVGNKLSSLDVSGATALSSLECDDNILSSLDVSKNANLEVLSCPNNNLSSLDVSKNANLEWLECGGNNLSSLDVSKNANLEVLSCPNNNLSSLDVSKNTELYYIAASNQSKEVVEVNGEIALTDLDPVIKAANITNVKGATLSGDKFTNITGSTITYDYKTGYNDETMDVTLDVISKGMPSAVSLNKNLIALDKGKTGKLSAKITPDNAEDKTVTWFSSDPKVATVDSSGNVTAVNHGKAVITAKTANGKTAACEVRVNFADVASESLYYYKPVYWAAESGITTGSNGLFAPHNKCTREHAITFLWRMAGSPAPKSMNSKFKDIQNKNSYSYKAIMWGTENGIITGANGVFAPNNTCTREQIVTMLWRLAGKPEPKNTTSKFKDVQNKNSYSHKAILWAAEKGITTGANGSFAPGKVCTRAEIVTFIYRYKN